MTNQIDSTFAALSDPTRRAVVERLTQGPASVSDLHGGHTIALPTFLRHLKVLEDSGLITSTKQGRVRTCAIDPAPLHAVETWLASQRGGWALRLDRLGTLATQMERTRS